MIPSPMTIMTVAQGIPLPSLFCHVCVASLCLFCYAYIFLSLFSSSVYFVAFFLLRNFFLRNLALLVFILAVLRNEVAFAPLSRFVLLSRDVSFFGLAFSRWSTSRSYGYFICTCLFVGRFYCHWVEFALNQFCFNIVFVLWLSAIFDLA